MHWYRGRCGGGVDGIRLRLLLILHVAIVDIKIILQYDKLQSAITD